MGGEGGAVGAERRKRRTARKMEKIRGTGKMGKAEASAKADAATRPFRGKIRWATRADAAALQAIYAHYVENTTVSFELEAPDVAETERRIAAVEGVYPFLVCVAESEDDGSAGSVGKNVKTGKVDGGERIVGYASAHRAFERAAYAWTAETTVYVDRNWRRLGIGEALYSALIEILEAQGVRTLYAVVVAENKASVDFHRRAGYREFATFKNSGWKFGRWLDVVWLERTLGVWRDAEKGNAEKVETGTEPSSETAEKAAEKGAKGGPAPTAIRPVAALPKERLTAICDAAARTLGVKKEA